MSPPAVTLPYDITEDILSRLPAKSLVRFQLVSTSWRSLVSDPIFRKIHFNRTFQNPNLSARRALLVTPTRFMLLDPQKPFRGDGGALVDLRSPVDIENRRLTIVGCCNGLICFGLDDFRDIFIWNPSTGDCSKLPKPITPVGDSYTAGFGHDSSSDDYKVLLATFYHEYEVDSKGVIVNCYNYRKVSIFSLKRNSWKLFEFSNGIPHNFLRLLEGVFPQSVYLNGAIHWRCSFSPNGSSIFAFDVSKESFYIVPSPPNRLCFTCTNGLGVLDDCLCLVGTKEYGNSIFELWLMKEYGVKASWTKLIPLLNPKDRKNRRYSDFYEPLCASGDNTVALIRNARVLIRFNERGELVEYKGIGYVPDKVGGIAFVESIVSAEISSAERGEILDESSIGDGGSA